IGAFHQPRLVLADTGALATLPRRELLAGYAEVVKYGLINDASFFQWLEGHGMKTIEGDRRALQRAVLTSCAAKAAIVAADERESGQRALLNLGHTFGHALEAQLGYGGELLHGEAIAVGLVLAYELSARLGLAPAEDAARVRRHLAAVGLPTDGAVLTGRAWSPQALIEHMTRDKKVRRGRIAFVLTRGIGQAFLSEEVRLEDVEALLAEELAA
ncbi:MAG: 3-dehydroquinate synthase family protein, partial [Kiloniellales bacterium]